MKDGIAVAGSLVLGGSEVLAVVGSLVRVQEGPTMSGSWLVGADGGGDGVLVGLSMIAIKAVVGASMISQVAGRTLL